MSPMVGVGDRHGGFGLILCSFRGRLFIARAFNHWNPGSAFQQFSLMPDSTRRIALLAGVQGLFLSNSPGILGDQPYGNASLSSGLYRLDVFVAGKVLATSFSKSATRDF